MQLIFPFIPPYGLQICGLQKLRIEKKEKADFKNILPLGEILTSLILYLA